MTGACRRPVLAAVLALLWVACGGNAAAAEADGRINVSVPVFATGLPRDSSAYAELGVFPRIREIEARFLPFALRRRLADSGKWGAVRVVRDDAVIEELVVHGEILQSDGRRLEVRIRAVDAAGEAWLDERFSDTPQPGSDEPAFERLFARVADRLGQVLDTRSASQLSTVRELALLRYGARLAPKTFDQYVDESKDGSARIRRLPARNDPMLDRISRIREAEYVIIDAADTKYEALHDDIESIYTVWREFSQKSLGYEAEDARRIAHSEPPGPRGSYEALLHAYDNYKFSRLTAEERDDMAVAFYNEVRPTFRRLDERLGTYNAWLEGKYNEWNRLLEELNELETRVSD